MRVCVRARVRARARRHVTKVRCARAAGSSLTHVRGRVSTQVLSEHSGPRSLRRSSRASPPAARTARDAGAGRTGGGGGGGGGRGVRGLAEGAGVRGRGGAWRVSKRAACGGTPRGRARPSVEGGLGGRPRPSGPRPPAASRARAHAASASCLRRCGVPVRLRRGPPRGDRGLEGGCVAGPGARGAGRDATASNRPGQLPARHGYPDPRPGRLLLSESARRRRVGRDKDRKGEPVCVCVCVCWKGREPERPRALHRALPTPRAPQRPRDVSHVRVRRAY